MSERFIEDYLLKIGNVYKRAAAEIAVRYDEYNSIKRDIVSTQNSRLLTMQGKSKKVDELSRQRDSIMRDIEQIRKDANEAAKKIRHEADVTFGKYYAPSKEDIDPQTVALLDSDIQKLDELLKMAEGANITTKRLIGKALERRGFKREAAQLQATIAPAHLIAMDNVIQWGDFYCGGARMSGYGICKDAAKKYDDVVAPIIAAAPKLVYKMNYDTMKMNVVKETA